MLYSIDYMREQPCPQWGALDYIVDALFFLVPEDVSEQNVSDWVNGERFEAFVHITRSNFHDITETGKYM